MPAPLNQIFGTMQYTPVRGYLRSLTPPIEDFQFPMNPNRLVEAINVGWRELMPIGMSHPRQQYTGTGAHMIPGVTFLVNRRKLGAEKGRELSAYEFLDFKRFLQAHTVPPSGSKDVAGGSPSRLLFLWPGVITLTTVLRNLRVTYTRFNHLGEPMAYDCQVDFAEIRDTRVTHEEIRDIGSQRSEL